MGGDYKQAAAIIGLYPTLLHEFMRNLGLKRRAAPENTGQSLNVDELWVRLEIVVATLRCNMPHAIQLEVQLPGDLAKFRLPKGVAKRLQALLDKQDEGQALTADERREAEGLVDLAELLSLLRLRTQRLSRSSA